MIDDQKNFKIKTSFKRKLDEANRQIEKKIWARGLQPEALEKMAYGSFSPPSRLLNIWFTVWLT